MELNEIMNRPIMVANDGMGLISNGDEHTCDLCRHYSEKLEEDCVKESLLRPMDVGRIIESPCFSSFYNDNVLGNGASLSF